MRAVNRFIGTLQMYNFFFKWANFFLSASIFFLKCLNFFLVYPGLFPGSY